MVYVTENKKDFEINENEINVHYNVLKSTQAVYKRQLYRLVSNKMQLLSVILMPILWLAIIGTSFSNFVPPSALGGENFLTFMAPGIFIMVTLFCGIFGGF